MIYVGRGSTRLGSFPEEEVRQGLASGRFFPTDLGWKENMEHWRPLATFPELAERPPELPEPEPTHRSMEFVEERPGLPWEHWRERGFFTAFGATLGLVIFHPGRAFAMMGITRERGNALLYAVIGTWISSIVVISANWPEIWDQMRHAAAAQNPPLQISEQDFRAYMIGMIVGWPFIVTIGVFLWSFFMTLSLALVGVRDRAFDTTFRVLCFSMGSAYFLQIIPTYGPLLSMVWMFGCVTVGLARGHEIPMSRAMAAMLPIFCCFGLLLYLGVGATPP